MASIEKRSLKNGSIRYRVKVRLKGAPIQSASFEKLTDARRWVQQIESAIREGRHFKTAKARRYTLGELIDRYIADELPKKPKSQAKQAQQLRWWKDEIGDYLLSDISSSLLVECRDRLSKGITYRGTQRSPATVVRYMAALSHAFTIAVNEWEWLESSPMRKIKKPRESRGRVRFLDDDERERLLQACEQSSNPWLYTIVVLAISTGMRQGEIMNLTWKDVNLEQGFLILHETKNGERRRVPITEYALVLLEEHFSSCVRSSSFLFSSKDGQKPMDIRRPWENALIKAEIEDFRFHDLRHTAASYLAMNGASLSELQEIMGHKSFQMVRRYAHLSESHISSVVADMNGKIFGDDGE